MKAGPFWVTTGVRTDVTAPAVKEIFTEVKRIVSTRRHGRGVDAGQGRDCSVASGQFETNQATTGALSAIFMYGLPLNYYATLPAHIDAVNASDVQRGGGQISRVRQAGGGRRWRRHGIRPTLEKDIGPAQLRNAEGQVLPK